MNGELPVVLNGGAWDVHVLRAAGDGPTVVGRSGGEGEHGQGGVAVVKNLEQKKRNSFYFYIQKFIRDMPLPCLDRSQFNEKGEGGKRALPNRISFLSKEPPLAQYEHGGSTNFWPFFNLVGSPSTFPYISRFFRDRGGKGGQAVDANRTELWAR